MTKLIAIDVPHGSDTYEKKRSKAVSVNGKIYEEHDFGSKVSIELDKLLKKHGFKTLMYQKPFSPEISLDQRINYYNRMGVDLVVSPHANAGTPSAKGLAAFYWHTAKDSKRLADLYAGEVKAYGYNTYGSGSRASVPNTWSDFAICRDTNMTAILSENGFMTNAEEFKLIFKSDKYIKDVAEIHTKAICKFYGVKYKEEKAEEKKTSTKPSSASIEYEAHVQSIGWQGKRKDGQGAGTTGKSLRLEALTVKLEGTDAKLEMQGHIQSKGWTSLRTNGEVIGTVGEALRLEAIKIKANGLNIHYRVHVEKEGWTAWRKNGEVAGTTGQQKRIEAIEIKLV